MQKCKLVKQQACQGSGSIVRAFFDVHSPDQIKRQNLSNPSSPCESGVLRLECRKMQQNKSASSAMKSFFAESDWIRFDRVSRCVLEFWNCGLGSLSLVSRNTGALWFALDEHDCETSYENSKLGSRSFAGDCTDLASNSTVRPCGPCRSFWRHLWHFSSLQLQSCLRMLPWGATLRTTSTAAFAKMCQNPLANGATAQVVLHPWALRLPFRHQVETWSIAEFARTCLNPPASGAMAMVVLHPSILALEVPLLPQLVESVEVEPVLLAWWTAGFAAVQLLAPVLALTVLDREASQAMLQPASQALCCFQLLRLALLRLWSRQSVLNSACL